jgi:hypothetical protein
LRAPLVSAVRVLSVTVVVIVKAGQPQSEDLEWP